MSIPIQGKKSTPDNNLPYEDLLSTSGRQLVNTSIETNAPQYSTYSATKTSIATVRSLLHGLFSATASAGLTVTLFADPSLSVTCIKAFVPTQGFYNFGGIDCTQGISIAAAQGTAGPNRGTVIFSTK